MRNVDGPISDPWAMLRLITGTDDKELGLDIIVILERSLRNDLILFII